MKIFKYGVSQLFVQIVMVARKKCLGLKSQAAMPTPPAYP